MQRRCPGVVKSKRPRSAPLPRFCVSRSAYLRLHVFAGKSLRNILSGRIEAGLGVHLAPDDFRRARGILRFALAMLAALANHAWSMGTYRTNAGSA